VDGRVKPGQSDVSWANAVERISASRVAKGERGIWQRRYWEHTLGDEDDFARHLDYIHFNPVKHGHVTGVGDWPETG
jgi:putative transposase